jgi:hypothetical protein
MKFIYVILADDSNSHGITDQAQRRDKVTQRLKSNAPIYIMHGSYMQTPSCACRLLSMLISETTKLSMSILRALIRCTLDA